MPAPDSANLIFRDPAHELYGSLASPEQIAYPASAEGHQALLDRITAHHAAGGHAAIVDGSFDVPHAGHPWYLRGCRLAAARRHFGPSFDRAERIDRIRYVASPLIMLVVTLDADYRVAQKKGFVQEKGNVSRPVYPWEDRANTVAGYMVPDGFGGFRPVVDIVTVEGEPQHAGTPLESHLIFGDTLFRAGALGTWIVYGEHAQTANAAREVAGDIVNVISPDSVVRNDAWGSSNIIKRIKAGNGPSNNNWLQPSTTLGN